MQEPGEAVSLRTFAQVLKPAWEAAAVPENRFKRFSSCGIHPFNPERVLQSEKLCPSLNFIAAGPPPTSAAPPPDNVPGTSFKSQPQQMAIQDLIYVLREVRKLPEETFEMMMGTCKEEGFVELEKRKFKLLCTPLPAVTPQVEPTEDYGHLADVLKLPTFTKSTTKKSATAASMSMALTGDAYRSYLKKKQLEKEKALEAKEQRKIAREENKKRNAQEKEEKQKTREEAKKKKVEEKERKAQEQARKKMEREDAPTAQIAMRMRKSLALSIMMILPLIMNQTIRICAKDATQSQRVSRLSVCCAMDGGMHSAQVNSKMYLRKR